MALSHDFTKGNLFKSMIFYSWPIFLSNLLQVSFQIIDSYWVGNLLGSREVGAISISSTVIFAVLSFIIGINGAALTVLSQQKGADDAEGLRKSVNAFVTLLGCLAILLGIIGFFSSQWLLQLLGTPKSVMPMAVNYLQINFAGILFLFGYNFISTILRAMGDSKTPVQFVVIAVILNAILDPLFISGLNMGLDGAAYATIFSQGAAFLYGVYHSVKTGKVPFEIPHWPERYYLKTVMALGLPAGLQMLLISGGVAAIMSVVASFGEDVVAGFGVAQRMDSLIMLPAMTLGSAVNSMAGQNIGANKWDRVSLVARNGIYLILSVTLLISAIVVAGASWFISLFVKDAETIEFGAQYLRSIAFFYPFLGINFVLNGVVRASGAMVQVLILNLISFWILRYPLTYLFAQWFGERGIAYGMSVSFIISSVFAILYYKLGKWKDIRILKQDKEKDA
ncbi:putative efflux protein, MATE family [Fictibacillus enclensis]|uniref:MATE family efflux transporter n=1 Tax=Fictibacillus enclensis TaxID=1017270 RepID=A0A0V8J1R3_9BACL|nr:MATE family efflux transporter [Fictibacillus enclensis]KSU80889.1 MATE family efflux transporter [Fictibacillus enclensis]SCC32516.1 putative efflux protein, MATE family [Fictibacillus enclensis]